MAERREVRPSRTNRPDGSGVFLTVRDVLAEPDVQVGAPQVLVGESSLDVPVRWVYPSDSAGVARLLDGGELILSTGAGWPEDPDELERFVEGLADAGVAGLVIELGTHYRWVPSPVERAARSRGLVLVALHREVKFVAITQAVHHRIIRQQTLALRARDEVHERLTALALRGSPTDFVVKQLGLTLGSGVVLENLAHEVVTAEVPLADEEAVFADWEARSRAAHRSAADGRAGREDWLIVPVEARGHRWGHLIALPGPEHPAGRLAVLEQGAIALALGRLADGDDDEWSRLGRQRLLDGLLGGRFAAVAGAAARLEAAGMPVRDAQLCGLVLSGSVPSPDAADAAARAIGARALLGSSPGDVPGPAATVLLSTRTAALDDETIAAFARAACPDPAVVTVTVGSVASNVDGALRSLQEAIDLAHHRAGIVARGPVIRRATRRPLLRLVSTLRDDHRLLDHGERMLAPLIEHDLQRQGDLLLVLESMLRHPTNRTAAASASHLSRSVFYQRIALIQDLLGIDLEDGEVQTALHLALLARRTTT